MNLEEVPKAKKDRSSLILQLLAFIFGFLASSFFFGAGFLFAVLASAVSCADYLSKRGRFSFLGSVLGGGLGFVFVSYFRESTVRLVFDAKTYGKDFALVLDLRPHSLVLFLLIPVLSLVFCSCVARRASRSVCVAASTGVIAAAAIAQLVIFTVGKYSAFSLELLREKLEVLIGIFEAAFNAPDSFYPFASNNLDADTLKSLAVSIVYSIPSAAAVMCGALGFFHSFCVKRALKRSGALGFIYTDGWIFIPSIVSAVVYILLYLAMAVISLFSAGSDVSLFGLNVVLSLLSGAFLITGITAIRWFRDVRKKAGAKLGVLWIVAAVVFIVISPLIAVSFVRFAGLSFVFLREILRRRKLRPPEDQQGDPRDDPNDDPNNPFSGGNDAQ